MTKEQEPVHVCINRKRWLRGEKNGEGQLEDSMMRCPHGQMCCLGHIGRACKIPAKVLLELGTPADVAHSVEDFQKKYPLFAPFVERMDNIKDSTLSVLAMTINDNANIHDNARERKLIQLFAQHGFQVEFFG